MGVVNVDGKPVTVPDEVIDGGIETIRMALAIDIPDIEGAEITIDKPMSAAVITEPKTATVVKRSPRKG